LNPKYKAMRDAGKEQRDGDAVTDKTVANLRTQLVKLQMKYDLEHLAITQLQTELATVKQRIKKPAINPLASEVAALKKRVLEQEGTIRTYATEMNNLRDALRSSRKILKKQLPTTQPASRSWK
jgi:chromosome segregation ATPase